VEKPKEAEEKKQPSPRGRVLGNGGWRGAVAVRGGWFWLLKPWATVAGMGANCKSECVWTGEEGRRELKGQSSELKVKVEG
jgi:hypothetical protein